MDTLLFLAFALFFLVYLVKLNQYLHFIYMFLLLPFFRYHFLEKRT